MSLVDVKFKVLFRWGGSGGGVPFSETIDDNGPAVKEISKMLLPRSSRSSSELISLNSLGKSLQYTLQFFQTPYKNLI